MNFRLFYYIAIFFLTGLLLPTTFVFASNITGDYKYAWSNNVGYINFESVTVSDSALSGSAWSKNAGWIKFDPTNGGVSNNGQGVLSGYAWGEQLGWINFSGVSINTSTGKFSGTATSDLVGTLTFDCPTYCDVRTDWRSVASTSTPTPTPTPSVTAATPTPATVPASEPSPSIPKTKTSIVPGISKSEPTLKTSQSIRDQITEFYKTIGKSEPISRADFNHVEGYNAPLVIEPNQTGILVWDFSTPEMISAKQKQAVSIEVPRAVASSKITLFAERAVADRLPSLDQANIFGVVFDITVKDNKGNRVRKFSAPLKITLIVPEGLAGRKDLGVYYLSDGANEWVLIPDVVFDNISVSFSVNHLTRFAIFALKPDVLTKDGVLPATLAVAPDTSPRSFMWLYILIGALFLIWLSRRKRKSN